MTGVLQAGGIEGTIWYDAKGEVAWVEGPAAEKQAREPFVPHWVRAEQRRDRGRRPEFRAYRRYDDTLWTTGYAAGYRRPVRCWPATFRYQRVPCVRPLGGIGVIIR